MQLELVFLLLLSFSRGAPSDAGFPILNPGGIGGIFKGPDSETIIRGPDGSQITSEQKGGSVVTGNDFASPIVAAEIASPPELPLVVSSTVHPSLPPLVVSEASLSVAPIEIVQQDPHIVETEIVEAPDVEPEQSSDLKGPSGRIITKGSASIVSGPASTTITEPRKIILAPPKIAPEVLTASIQSSSIAPLSVLASEAPLELGYSSSEAPLTVIDSGRIDLGQPRSNSLIPPEAYKDSIPEVEYSSSIGVVSNQGLPLDGRVYSSTELPAAASTLLSVTTDPVGGPAVPATYLLPPDGSAESTIQLVSSTASPNIQKIRKIEDTVAADGRIDLGEHFSPKPSSQSPYQIPQVLSLALSKLYERKPDKDGNRMTIDDKLGELDQNEISASTGRNYLLPPDLSQSKYIAPALQRVGVDLSQVSLAQVPLSQVSKLVPGYGRI